MTKRTTINNDVPEYPFLNSHLSITSGFFSFIYLVDSFLLFVCGSVILCLFLSK